jgi:hypothetical protein
MKLRLRIMKIQPHLVWTVSQHPISLLYMNWVSTMMTVTETTQSSWTRVTMRQMMEMEDAVMLEGLRTHRMMRRIEDGLLQL